MKKFFYLSVMVLMATLTLTSCGDDDKKDEPKPQTPKSVVYNVSVEFSQELLDICNVTMTYKDGDGKTITETVTSKTWSKKVTVNKLPAVVGAKCDFNLKDGIQLTKDKYDLVANLYHYVNIDDNKIGSDQPNTIVGGHGVKTDKVADYISRWSGRLIYGYNIAANGAAVSTESITF
ncbi:MAG: hypothetical protein IKH19_03925 [Muribaculaceae bacterium]|nr:hypothetical protein [Muribaculaceae bacterium]